MGDRPPTVYGALARIRWGGAVLLAPDAMILVREQALRGRPRAQLAAGVFVMATYALAQRLLVDGFLDGLADAS